MVEVKSKPLPPINRLVGRWSAADEWATDVALIVSSKDGQIHVQAVDESDGEEAEILNLERTNEAIAFSAYWPSGQVTKYRLRSLLEGQLEVVFTVTATTTFKKSTAN